MARRPKQFEGSPADKKLDKKGAKAAGKSLKDFEGSPEDEAMDTAGQARMNKRPGKSKR